jgi:predicted alpha/beta hydrolase family esterase
MGVGATSLALHHQQSGKAGMEHMERRAAAALMEALEVDFESEEAAKMLRIRRRRRPELALVAHGVHVPAVAHFAACALDLPVEVALSATVGEGCGFVLRLAPPPAEGGEGCSIVYAE